MNNSRKRVVAAVPTHDVTTVPPRPASLDSSAVSQFNYDEDVHNLNKLTEDNSILEEAAEVSVIIGTVVTKRIPFVSVR
ncbi:hypothetical protein COOONC_10361 [Cooperia oncophora]